MNQDVVTKPLQQQVLERLAAEPEWRQALLADPRAAVSDLLEVTLPESMAFTVHENSVRNVHLVIPPTQEQLDELDLETLDLVGGGNGSVEWEVARVLVWILTFGQVDINSAQA